MSRRLVPQSWDAQAEAGLLVSAGDDLPWIRGEVLRGEAILMRCDCAGETEAYAVLRYEPLYQEMVFVLGEGRNFRRWLPILEAYARSKGAITTRAHINRPGLQRWYQCAGWEQAEIVMRKTL